MEENDCYMCFPLPICFYRYYLPTCYIRPTSARRSSRRQKSISFVDGAHLSFLISPPRGMLVLPDLIHMSSQRATSEYFGDDSVFRTTFSILYVVLAIVVFISPYGNRQAKLFFLLRRAPRALSVPGSILQIQRPATRVYGTQHCHLNMLYGQPEPRSSGSMCRVLTICAPAIAGSRSGALWLLGSHCSGV